MSATLNDLRNLRDLFRNSPGVLPTHDADIIFQIHKKNQEALDSRKEYTICSEINKIITELNTTSPTGVKINLTCEGNQKEWDELCQALSKNKIVKTLSLVFTGWITDETVNRWIKLTKAIIENGCFTELELKYSLHSLDILSRENEDCFDLFCQCIIKNPLVKIDFTGSHLDNINGRISKITSAFEQCSTLKCLILNVTTREINSQEILDKLEERRKREVKSEHDNTLSQSNKTALLFTPNLEFQTPSQSGKNLDTLKKSPTGTKAGNEKTEVQEPNVVVGKTALEEEALATSASAKASVS